MSAFAAAPAPTANLGPAAPVAELADRAVFWGTTLLCALAALILPLAG